jgi:hypothetical protein
LLTYQQNWHENNGAVMRTKNMVAKTICNKDSWKPTGHEDGNKKEKIWMDWSVTLRKDDGEIPKAALQ